MATPVRESYTRSSTESSLDSQEEFRPTSLVAATEKRDKKAIKYLIKKQKVDVNALEHPSIGQKLNNETLEVLDHNGGYVTISLTEEAAEHYHGGWPLTKTDTGWTDQTSLTRTALQTAADLGYEEIVDFLLEQRKIEINIQPFWEHGRTAYQAAVESGHLRIAEKLLEEGADINANWEQCPHELLEKILKLNGKQKDPSEPPELYVHLKRVLRARRHSTFQALLNYAQDVGQIMNRNQKELTKTVLHIAATTSKDKAVDWLKILSRDDVIETAINQKEFDGWTPLFVAVNSRELEIVHQFISKNPRLDHTDLTGVTALQMALNLDPDDSNTHIDIQNALLQAGASTKSLDTTFLDHLLKAYKIEPAETEIVQIHNIKALWREDIAEQYSGKTDIKRLEPTDCCLFPADADESEWLAPALVFNNFLKKPSQVSNATKEGSKSFANPENFLKKLGIHSMKPPMNNIAPERGLGAAVGWYSLFVQDIKSWKKNESTWTHGIPKTQAILREGGSMTMILAHLYFRFPRLAEKDDKIISSDTDDDEHIELAWLMRTYQKANPTTKSKTATDPPSDKIKRQPEVDSKQEAIDFLIRSFHFRVNSSTEIHSKLKVPEHGAEFVGFFISNLYERWKELIQSGDDILLNLSKRQLKARGEDKDIIDCLLIASSRWIDWNKVLKDHEGKLRDLVKTLITDKVVREDLRGDSDKHNQAPKTEAGGNTKPTNAQLNASEATEPAILNRKEKIYRDSDQKNLEKKLRKFLEKTRERFTNLEKQTDKLIEREFNLCSIREARNSYTVSKSMKRLSWITFIFLPPMFISGLFGMNVDVLKNSPSIGYFFAICIPTIALVLLANGIWYLLNDSRGQKQVKQIKTVYDKCIRGIHSSSNGDKSPASLPRKLEALGEQSVAPGNARNVGYSAEKPGTELKVRNITSMSGAVSPRPYRKRLASYFRPWTGNYPENPRSGA